MPQRITPDFPAKDLDDPAFFQSPDRRYRSACRFQQLTERHRLPFERELVDDPLLLFGKHLCPIGLQLFPSSTPGRGIGLTRLLGHQVHSSPRGLCVLSVSAVIRSRSPTLRISN